MHGKHVRLVENDPITIRSMLIIMSSNNVQEFNSALVELITYEYIDNGIFELKKKLHARFHVNNYGGYESTSISLIHYT